MKSVLAYNALMQLIIQCETLEELEPLKNTITRMYDEKFLNENASSEEKRMGKDLRKCIEHTSDRIYTESTNNIIRQNFQ